MTVHYISTQMIKQNLNVFVSRYTQFVQGQGLKDSQCIVFAHRRPSAADLTRSQMRKFAFWECDDKSQSLTSFFTNSLKLMLLFKKPIPVFLWANILLYCYFGLWCTRSLLMDNTLRPLTHVMLLCIPLEEGRVCITSSSSAQLSLQQTGF